MTHESREMLNRAAGILEGLNASGELSSAAGEMLAAVIEMIDAVLNQEARNDNT